MSLSFCLREIHIPISFAFELFLFHPYFRLLFQLGLLKQTITKIPISLKQAIGLNDFDNVRELGKDRIEGLEVASVERRVSIDTFLVCLLLDP